jgi:hypothetical protein
MSSALLGKIAIRTSHHSRKTYAIGLHSGQLNVFSQFTVLFADTRGIEKQIHTTYTLYQCHQPISSIGAGNVDLLDISSTNAIQ